MQLLVEQCSLIGLLLSLFTAQELVPDVEAFLPMQTRPSSSSQSKPSLPPSSAQQLLPLVGKSTTTLLLGAFMDDDTPSDSGGGNKDDDTGRRSYEQAMEHNRKRTDIRRFLTQRALQSFIDLLLSCRDPHTVRWLEERYNFTNLENYHGTGAWNLDQERHRQFFGAWDTMLMDLLHQPPAMVVVAAKRRGGGHGGWSGNNPNLQDRFVEYEIDIEPCSLVSRILSVRSQIAQEWVSDLETLVLANEEILALYHDKQNHNRQEEECLEHEDGDNAEDDDHHHGEDLAGAGHVGPAESSTPTLSETTASHSYDRMSLNYLRNKMIVDNGRSSSMRMGSFDLLCLLTTQEAVHRVLNEYKADENREGSFLWLRDFYVKRVPKHFDGDGPLGRADDFLQDLLLSPPTVRDFQEGESRGNGDGGSSSSNSRRRDGKVEVALIDPLRITSDIIASRTLVAREWGSVMANEIPSDHMELQRAILTVRMGTTLETSGSENTAEKAQEVPFSDGFE